MAFKIHAASGTRSYREIVDEVIVEKERQAAEKGRRENVQGRKRRKRR